MEIRFPVPHAGGECHVLARVREDGLLDVLHSSCETLLGQAFGRMCACRVLVADRAPEVARAAWDVLRSTARTTPQALRAARFLEQYARDEAFRIELVSVTDAATTTPLLLELLLDGDDRVRRWAGEQLVRQLTIEEVPMVTAFALQYRHQWSLEYWGAHAVAAAVQRTKGPRARAIAYAHFLAMHDPGSWDRPYVPDELPLTMRERLARLFSLEFDRTYRRYHRSPRTRKTK